MTPPIPTLGEAVRKAATDLRDRVAQLRSRPIPLKDMIPLMQQAADLLDVVAAQQAQQPALPQGWKAVIDAALAWGNAEVDDDVAMLAAELVLSEAITQYAEKNGLSLSAAPELPKEPI